MGEPSLGVRPSEKLLEERLDSWKEIAAYLNRDVTTVQRWEKREGMPVHRHLHDKRGSVYALSSELDTWQHSRRATQDEEDEERVEPEEAPVTESEFIHGAKPRRVRGFVFAGLAAGICLCGLGYFLISRNVARDTVHAKIQSLAVLPLKNLSGDPSQDYLADGMTEAIIGRLAGIHDLRVISHTSVM